MSIDRDIELKMNAHDRLKLCHISTTACARRPRARAPERLARPVTIQAFLGCLVSCESSPVVSLGLERFTVSV
jgi:hypothetical protein